MKRTVYQMDDERSVLTSIIVHDQVIARVSAKSGKEPFGSKWSNIVYSWCLKHYEKYGTAPKSSIQAHFRHFAEKSQDEATVKIVEKYLSGLSEEYAQSKKELNEDFAVDQAARYFNRVRVEKRKDKIEDSLTRGDVDEALQQITTFQPLQLATDDMVSVFDDREAWEEALQNQEQDILIHYGGALGEFYGTQFQSDGFIAYLAPEKRGKTFFLLDNAWTSAVKNKRRTIYYSVGDMSKRQMMRRLAVRACKRPIEAGEFVIPRRIRLEEGATARVKKETLFCKHRLSMSNVKTAVKGIRQLIAAKKSTLRLRCTPNSTTRVADIEQDIEQGIREGWVPQVVVLDYADILAPERQLGEGDVRHQTDETWKALRRLSQKYHILVITATQSNTGSYSAGILRRTHFSEDKRKLAHVTGMIGINQTEEEKDRGLFRLNQVLLREGYYSESRCVTVAGCLAIANPAMLSAW